MYKVVLNSPLFMDNSSQAPGYVFRPREMSGKMTGRDHPPVICPPDERGGEAARYKVVLNSPLFMGISFQATGNVFEFVAVSTPGAGGWHL